MVAERWGCSANHVRNLIKRGELPAFRLGKRLIRIPVAAVEEFEHCAAPADTGGSSNGAMIVSETIVLTLTPAAQRADR